MMTKHQQRQVWQRVYAGNLPERPLPKVHLQNSLQRLQQNLTFYNKQADHPIYGAAFRQLSRQTQEHIQMLRQILET